MREFNTPEMIVQRIEPENILRTSYCSTEGVACVSCYCDAVTCEGVYTCKGLRCAILHDFD